MSEKEGELKKRIDNALEHPEIVYPKKQSFQEWFEDLKNGDQHARYTNKLIQSGYILKLLDEAKAEFPHRHNVTIQSNDGQVVTTRIFDCREINDWRTKWFGESK